MDDKLLSCGEFANYCGITRKTLIFYDNNDILKPYELSETGYRYYHPKQIMMVKMIKAYQTAGLSLDEIRNILYSNNKSSFSDVAIKQAEVLQKQIFELETTRLILLQTVKNEEILKKHPLNELFFEKREKTGIISRPYSSDVDYYELRGPVGGGCYTVKDELNNSPDSVFRLPMFSDEKCNGYIPEGEYVAAMIGTFTVTDAIKKFRSIIYDAEISTDRKFYFIDMSNDMIISNKKESILKIMAKVKNQP